MRKRLLAGALASLLVPAAEAAAGDPIMPLSDVRAGMQCTGYSVVHGTEPAAFDVEIVDVIGSGPHAYIVVRVSGEAVDSTGIGAGFSGSPVYCPGEDGVARNAGAISATIGEWGGKTALATPIETVLQASPVPAPGGQADDAAAGNRTPAGARKLRSARQQEPSAARGGAAGARATPLTIAGLSQPVFRALQRRAASQGLSLLPAAPTPRQAPGDGPGAASAADAGLEPGSAVSIGLSSGAVSLGAIGTVAYTDGPNVWTLGHAFEALGPRNLFLQNAYVSTVINNPLQVADIGSYKLATPMGNVGTVTDDTFGAVAGRVGGLPVSTPVRVYAQDSDDGRLSETVSWVADESVVGTPGGMSAVSFIGPVAVAEAASGLFASNPGRMKATACFQIVLRERPEPIRLCNRYVADGMGFGGLFGNVAALGASGDLAEMLAMIDAYKPAALRVEEVSTRVRVSRGQYQAFIRSARLPRRARPGQRIPVRLRVQRVRGERETITFRMRAPKRPGLRRVVLQGSEPDLGGDLFGGFEIFFGDEEEHHDTTGPRTVAQLVEQMRTLKRYDGIRTNRGRPVYRHPELRIGGRVKTHIEIRRRRR